MGINYAPIINRIDHLSEKVLCSKNDKIVTKIWEQKKDKKVPLAV